jgi:5-methylcytosine-specific restriction endonuclease McrA
MAGVCTVCGRVTSRGPRCLAHPHRKTTRPNPTHADPRWHALSRRLIAAHVGQYGWTCPGDGPHHAPHATSDLTCDHIVALSDGGSPFDRSNLRILCRSWNSSLGATLGNAKRATT